MMSSYEKHGRSVVCRMSLNAGERTRNLDKQCAEALGWRVSRDPYWNHPDGPEGDEYCIRRDGRTDIPCDEALPRFTPALFHLLSQNPRAEIPVDEPEGMKL